MPSDETPYVRKFMTPMELVDLGLDAANDSWLIAILRVESSLDPNGMRYEPDYQYIYDAAAHAKMNGITLETEIQLQKFSYGLGHLMGGTARELGFKGMLHGMIDPKTNVIYARKYFQRKLELYNGDVSKAVMAYNSGSILKSERGQRQNEDYLTKVKKAAGVLPNMTRWTSQA